MRTNSHPCVMAVLLVALSGCTSATQHDEEPVPAPDGTNGSHVPSVVPARWSAAPAPVGDPANGWGGPVKDRAEVTVAVNPINPRNMIAGAWDLNWENMPNHGQPGPTTPIRGPGVYASHDGGATWKNDWLPIEFKGGANHDTADPAIAFDSTGNAYYAIIVLGGRGLQVFRSEDEGRSWTFRSVAVKVFTDAEGCRRGHDKEFLAVDPADDRLYMTYAESLNGCRDGRPDTQRVVLIASDDGGATWSAPVPVTPTDATQEQFATPAVGPNGTLFVSYERLPPDVSPESPCVPSWAGQVGSPSVWVATSSDRGATWTQHFVSNLCDVVLATPEAASVVVGVPALAVDPSTGLAAVAWSHRSVPNSPVLVSTSNDLGASWSRPAALPNVATSGYVPWVDAADGVLRVAYLAFLPGGIYETVVHESTDGKTWTGPASLSRVSCACFSYKGRTPASLGHYIGMDSVDGVVVAVFPMQASASDVLNVWARVGSYR